MAQARPVYSNDPGPRFDYCYEESKRLLAHAADEWSKGDPSQPDSAEVLNRIIEIFANEKFLRRPYGAGKT